MVAVKADFLSDNGEGCWPRHRHDSVHWRSCFLFDSRSKSIAFVIESGSAFVVVLSWGSQLSRRLGVFSLTTGCICHEVRYSLFGFVVSRLVGFRGVLAATPRWSCNSSGQSPTELSITCFCRIALVAGPRWSCNSSGHPPTELSITCFVLPQQAVLSINLLQFVFSSRVLPVYSFRWRHPDGAATRLGARQQNCQSPVLSAGSALVMPPGRSCNSPGGHHANRQSPVPFCFLTCSCPKLKPQRLRVPSTWQSTFLHPAHRAAISSSGLDTHFTNQSQRRTVSLGYARSDCKSVPRMSGSSMFTIHMAGPCFGVHRNASCPVRKKTTLGISFCRKL